MSTELKSPIKDVLRDPLASIDSEQVLRAIHERPRTDSLPAARRHAVEPPGRRGFAWGGLALVAAAALFVVSRGTTWIGGAETVLGRISADDAPRTYAFEDGSEVTLESGASGNVATNDATHVAIALDRGRAAFSVNPATKRRWSVACGNTRVTVVGTVFRVDRTAQSTAVSVQRGTVWVEGASLPHHLAVLHAGDHIVVVDR